MKKILASFIFSTIAISSYGMVGATTSGSTATIQVNVLGYVLTQPADLGVIQFPNITTSDMAEAQTQEGGPIQFSAITTYPEQYPDPNLELHVTVGDNHITPGEGAYLTNPDSPATKLYYTLTYSPCGTGSSSLPLIQATGTPTPNEVVDNAHASESACNTSPGHLTFTRQAITSALIPSAGEYAGSINITAQATSDA